MFRNSSFIVAVTILILVTGVVALTNGDEISVLFGSWLGEKPRMLVRLEIRLPQVDADRCAVIVKRFPTMYNPTENGYTELLYKGVHSPGTIVEVKNTLFAYVARYRLDPRTNELVIDYYEPQEYAVFVNCVRGNATIFKWVKVVEVFPRSMIHTERVEVGGSYDKLGLSLSDISLSPSESNPFSCNIVIVEEGPTPYKLGECYTWVKGPIIYSISGLNTSFILYNYPRVSAVYLEAYADSEFCVTGCRSESQVQWRSVGKKLTPSLIGRETTGLTGYYKDTIYFYVRYKYEWSVMCDGFAGFCVVDWILYPADIRSVARTGEEPSLPYSRYLYIPPTPPYYKSPGGVGETIIGFAPEGTSETDTFIPGITVSFTYAGFWSASLTVNYYKAVRDDTQYTTPFIKVNATRNYWWWYKDNDPRNYELLVAPRYP